MSIEWPDFDLPPINLLNAPALVKTECQKRCRLDESRTYCTGCFRTMEEIAKKGIENARRQGKPS